MKGKQQIRLSHESVKEALQDYLHKHVAQNVFLAVSVWAPFQVYENGTSGPPDVTVDFEQAEGQPAGKSGG